MAANSNQSAFLKRLRISLCLVCWVIACYQQLNQRLAMRPSLLTSIMNSHRLRRWVCICDSPATLTRYSRLQPLLSTSWLIAPKQTASRILKSITALRKPRQSITMLTTMWVIRPQTIGSCTYYHTLSMQTLCWKYSISSWNRGSRGPLSQGLSALEHCCKRRYLSK